MRFSTWILTQTGRDDPIGDLADDIAHDPQWPHSIKEQRKYLASTDAAPAYELALAEWRVFNQNMKSWRKEGRFTHLAERWRVK